MRLSVWDEPVLDFFVRGTTALADKLDLEVVRANRRRCRELLLLGEVDVALVPTLSVFTESELFDPLPAVALSTWDYPFLKLQFKKNLGDPIESIAINPFYAQEALVAKIILKEHYEKTPSFHPYTDVSTDVMLRTDDDASLVVASTLDEAADLVEAVDVGRDWFELTHYPMVWGLFVMRKGEATTQAVQTLRKTAHFIDIFKERWLEEGTIPEPLRHFFNEGLRYRLDDMAVASLTTFQDYLYYDNVVEELEPLVFYETDDVEDDDLDQPLL